jgi:hypothetical protein
MAEYRPVRPTEDAVVIHRYALPYVAGEGWATVILEAGAPGTGALLALSDWGNYSYAWSDIGGKDIREFLCRAERDPGYFYRKLKGPTDPYDGIATEKAIDAYILELRRLRSLSKDEARFEWQLVRDMDVRGNPIGYHEWQGQTGLDHDGELYTTGDDLAADAFVHKVLQRLVPILRAELAAEAWERQAGAS